MSYLQTISKVKIDRHENYTWRAEEKWGVTVAKCFILLAFKSYSASQQLSVVLHLRKFSITGVDVSQSDCEFSKPSYHQQVFYKLLSPTRSMTARTQKQLEIFQNYAFSVLIQINLIWFNSILHNLVPFCSLFYIKLSIAITFFYITSYFPLTPCHCIAAATARDRKVQGSIIPRASNHDDATRWLGWGLKSSKKHTSTFFKTVNLLPKDLRFEHEGAKLASCPGAISPRYPLINAIPTVRTGVRCVGRGGGGKPPAWKISR